jgi:hypothetical protein
MKAKVVDRQTFTVVLFGQAVAKPIVLEHEEPLEFCAYLSRLIEGRSGTEKVESLQ